MTSSLTRHFMLGLGLQVCRLEAEATASSALSLWVVLYTEYREMRKQGRIELGGIEKIPLLMGEGRPLEASGPALPP